jgi:hypothetical protein
VPLQGTGGAGNHCTGTAGDGDEMTASDGDEMTASDGDGDDSLIRGEIVRGERAGVFHLGGTDGVWCRRRGATVGRAMAAAGGWLVMKRMSHRRELETNSQGGSWNVVNAQAH